MHVQALTILLASSLLAAAAHLCRLYMFCMMPALHLKQLQNLLKGT